MKPTAKVIGQFGVIQLTIIAMGWLATKAFRKLHLVSVSETGLVRPERGLGEFFASYGAWFLIVPPLWCALLVFASGDAKRVDDTSAAAKLSLWFTVIIFIACAFAFMDMALNFSTVIKAR